MLGRPTPMKTERASRRSRAAAIVCTSAEVTAVAACGHAATPFITFSSIQARKSSRSRLSLSQNL